MNIPPPNFNKPPPNFHKQTPPLPPVPQQSSSSASSLPNMYEPPPTILHTRSHYAHAYEPIVYNRFTFPPPWSASSNTYCPGSYQQQEIKLEKPDYSEPPPPGVNTWQEEFKHLQKPKKLLSSQAIQHSSGVKTTVSYINRTPNTVPIKYNYPPPPSGSSNKSTIFSDGTNKSTAPEAYRSRQQTPFGNESYHTKTSYYPSIPLSIRSSSALLGTKVETERARLLRTWRSNFCETSEEITRKLRELAENYDEKDVWIRSSPADIFYKRTENDEKISTPRLEALCKVFEDELLARGTKIRSKLDPYKPTPRKKIRHGCNHKSGACSSSSDESDEEGFEPEDDCCMEELTRKIQHPRRLHSDLWHNEPGEMNDGPLCRCSVKSQKIGIRHGIFPGETGIKKCNPNCNNSKKLFHYRITISPPTNFLSKTPTIIKHDKHEFLFEGFSLLSHVPIGELPTCTVIRFNIEYTILYIEEKIPENFTIKELDIFFEYLFHELLELVDFNLQPSKSTDDTCPCYHFFPRFVRDLEDNGKEILSMSEVLRYLLDNSGSLVEQPILERMNEMSQHEWQDYVDEIKGMVVTNPGKCPSSVRIDQLDRNTSDLSEEQNKPDPKTGVIHPAIVHFGIRPPQLSYAGNPEYQKAWREYIKFRHLLANMSKPSYDDKRKLEEKEERLHDMQTQGRMMRNITVAITSKGFYRTGLMCDVVQHALLIPVLTGHLRFHQSLNLLEQTIEYKFKNRYLLQLALTHPSYKENFGTNPDHARNSLTNCGIRQPEYGDRKIHYMNTKKRGINTLINIMSRFGKESETDSNITHNERLEFLGDAVVEFLSSIHLFFMFPDVEEGGLATYRAAIVQNQHLAVLAKKIQLEEYMLYAHGSDLCHELELRHAMANCFEALMGALLLDGGITSADRVFAHALYGDNSKLKDVWDNYSPHPLQEQEPLGDRQWIDSYPALKELTTFEDSIGINFKHIRLLARAFTDRSIGFNHLTLGSNQRLEFLGDTVLQIICSEYLYRHFPEHHEGHLSLLRSSLVNNRTQAVVCDDLGMTKYAVYSNPKANLKTKDRADLLEAFLGALYVDKGLEYCQKFCEVCFFPRLQMFIMNQDWNDPKSKLQQCCLTLRTMGGGEPDIPVYKVINSTGPTNTRVYTVAVYFRGKRLAKSTGHSIQQAEMNAAKMALQSSGELFPQLDHQKRVIAHSIKKQKGKLPLSNTLRNESVDISNAIMNKRNAALSNLFDDSHLPKQYRMQEDISSDEFELNEIDNDDNVSIASTTKTSFKKKRKSRKNKNRKKISKEVSSCEVTDSSKYQKTTSLSFDDNLSSISDDDIQFLNNSSDLTNEPNQISVHLSDLVEKVSSSEVESGEITS